MKMTNVLRAFLILSFLCHKDNHHWLFPALSSCIVSACRVYGTSNSSHHQNIMPSKCTIEKHWQHPCVKTFSGGVWGWELPLFHFLAKASPELLDVKGLETHQRVAHNEFSCLFPWLPHWRATALLCPSPLVKPKKRRQRCNAPHNESSRVRLQSRKEHSPFILASQFTTYKKLGNGRKKVITQNLIVDS